MTSKADVEKTYFHNYQNQSRANNPTFNSSFVNGSLTLFTPQKGVESKTKKTQYKSNFQPFSDKVNILSVYQQSHNYARFSKQALEKSKSYLSQYGSNLIQNKSQIQLSSK